MSTLKSLSKAQESTDPIAIATKKFWEQETVRGRLVYPDEHVMRFVHEYASKDDTILDFGCGFGHHALAFSFDNFNNVIAMDYNNPCLEHIKEESDKHNLNIKCIQNGDSSVPLEENSVDVVVACGALFNSRPKVFTELLKNLNKAMKKDGLMWCNFRTPDDDLIKSATEDEKNFYKVKFDSSNTEVGYFAAPADELKAIFENVGFEVISLDKCEFTSNNQQQHNGWYVLNVKKAS